jgi:hypothetical protein
MQYPHWLIVVGACLVLVGSIGLAFHKPKAEPPGNNLKPATPGERIADMPHWMGGLPEGVPPRRGTPEYDAWAAGRAQEAARQKTNQPK